MVPTDLWKKWLILNGLTLFFIKSKCYNFKVLNVQVTYYAIIFQGGY